MTDILLLTFLFLIAGVVAVPIASRLGLGGGQVALTAAAVMAVGMVMGISWSVALTIGLVMALSSTAIVLQTLAEKGLMKSDGGQSSFSVLLFQDIAVIAMLALVPLLALPELTEAMVAAAEESGEHAASLSLVEGLPGWGAALVTLGAVAVVIGAGSLLTGPVFRFIAAAQLRELFVATALMMVIGIALLMSLVGLSPALGTFLAGVVLANSEYRHELESDIDPFKGLLLGLFFMTVGAGLHDRVRASFNSSIVLIVVYVFPVVLVLYFLRTPIADLFNAQGVARDLIFLFCGPLSLAWIFNGVIFVANASYNNLGHPFYSTWVNWGRNTLGIVPFVYFGALYWGAEGVLIGQMLGGVFVAIASFILAERLMKATASAPPETPDDPAAFKQQSAFKILHHRR